MCDHAHVASTCHRTAGSRVFLRTLDDHVVAPCRRTCFTHLHCSISACQARSTLACWCGTPHLVTLDALLASKHQFSARSHGTRVWPRVAFPPRTSWAAKLGSLAFKNGLSSEVRNWPSFLVQNLDQVLGVLYFTYNPRLGPFSGPRTWSRFWTKNWGRFWFSANHFSRVHVCRVVQGSRHT